MGLVSEMNAERWYHVCAVRTAPEESACYDGSRRPTTHHDHKLRALAALGPSPGASSRPTLRPTIHYNVGTFKGHSGPALLLRGQQVIGLHSEGFYDLPQEYS